MQQVLGYSALKTGLAWLATRLTGLALAGPAQILVTRASAKLVMAAGMTLVGAGILWATQVPAHGQLLGEPGRPVLPGRQPSPGRSSRYRSEPWPASPSATPGSPPGCINTSQQIGGAIGDRRRLHRGGDPLPPACCSQGHAAAAALTGGFHWAFWVSGLTALAAVPVAFLLIRRTELARAVAASLQREAAVSAHAD